MDGVIRLPDTPAPFRAWLESLPGSQVVGRPGDCSACPLAMFLQEQNPGMAIGVDDSWYRTNAPEDKPEWLPLPQWSELFVAAMDQVLESTITATACLTILEGLPHD